MWANAQLGSCLCGAVPTTAVSWLDRLTQKPTPRIKHRVASCHTAEVMSIGTFTCLTSYPKGTTNLNHLRWNLTMFGMDVVAWRHIDPVILDFLISLALCNGRLKVLTLGSKIGFLAPQIF